ncbi:MAG: LysR substrate-binding domain-containing protein [Pseudomonadota bacterium]
MNLLASLRYLVALSEHKHFARAAAACHITQPALSNALRALEKELGTPIVQRGHTYAGLTAEGEQVLASAQRMLHEHLLLQQRLQSQADAPQGALRLGVVPTAVPLAARFAARLQARHPGVAPVVRAMNSQEIETGLTSLSLDLGLGFTERTRKRGSPFAALAQYEERYFLVRRATAGQKPAARKTSQGLQRGAAMGWREAAAYPLCLLTPDMHNRSIVDAAFAKAGMAVQPVIETNSTLTLALSVLAGEVCSVLPGALVSAVGGYAELEALPLVAPDVATPVGFITLAHRQHSRVLEAALALAKTEDWQAELHRHSGWLEG